LIAVVILTRTRELAEVCPRVLAPNTEYIACVVPTFKLGCKAALGLTIADSELTAPNALAPAWSLAPTPPANVDLPVYYQWAFRTGTGGDFKSLARALKVRDLPPGLGRRTIDIAQAGFGAKLPASTTVDLEAALEPLAAPEPEPAWTGGIAQSFQKALAPIVNEPDRNQASDPHADPLLAPPLYGRWQAGRGTVNPGGVAWLDQLNLDPRWRVAAALGTQVIQQHQDALMTSAWEQAAEVARANQRMRQLQLSLAAGESLHVRHFRTVGMSTEMLLRIAAPAFGRLRDARGRTLLAQQSDSALPIDATRSAMRSIGRQRGPLSRRVAAQGPTARAKARWHRSKPARLERHRPRPGSAPMPSIHASLAVRQQDWQAP
jgi:hypothetical protein